MYGGSVYGSSFEFKTKSFLCKEPHMVADQAPLWTPHTRTRVDRGLSPRIRLSLHCALSKLGTYGEKLQSYDRERKLTRVVTPPCCF